MGVELFSMALKMIEQALFGKTIRNKSTVRLWEE